MANYILGDFDNASETPTSYSQVVALFLGYASSVAYENEDEVKNKLSAFGLLTGTEHFCFLNDSETCTQGFVVANDNLMVIAFRGTKPDCMKDWLTDLNTELTTASDFADGIQVHAGFYEGLCSVYDDLLNFIGKYGKDKKIWITGHSLGGALATLTAFKLHNEGYEDRILGLYTFGQPRVGNVDFAKAFDKSLGGKAYRLINNNDVVPRIPSRIEPLGIDENYSHYKGQLIYFDKDGLLQTDMSFLKKIYDDVAGRLSNFIDAIMNLDPRFSDGINDHLIENYIKCIKKPENVGDCAVQIDYPL